jgi:hypothetical protein
MQNLKIGDLVKVVNYGHPIYTPKKMWQDMHLCGFTDGKLKPDNILQENDEGWWHDINPGLVGKETEITGICQNGNDYATKLFSWASERQLQLIRLK